MNCPVCKTAMVIVECQAVEIDHCLACRGIWLDSGELELLLGRGEKDHCLKSFHPAEETNHPRRKCPICFKQMQMVTADHGAVIVDKCVKAHGLWFDANELEKVLSLKEFKASEKVKEFLKTTFGR